MGIFHYRSPLGAYKLNYTQAEEACRQEGGTIATYIQLSYAQQVDINTSMHTDIHSIKVRGVMSCLLLRRLDTVCVQQDGLQRSERAIQ